MDFMCIMQPNIYLHFLSSTKIKTVMSVSKSLIAEIKSEAANTRKILERVPVEKNSWKPHAKSMALGRLAYHVAELPGWVTMVMATDELDWAKFEYKPTVAETTAELLEQLDDHVEQAIAILETCEDSDFDKMWSMRNGEHIYFTLPKSVALRTFALSHNYHHRAQLGVFLRLLDIPVPGMYGPTADEEAARAAKAEAVN
jgi:uncharacterized damage-inducible protein DinB